MAINTNHSLSKITATSSDLVLDAESQDSNISANSNRVINVQDPIDAQDAVTKSYLESQINSLSGGVTTNLDVINAILAKLTPPSPDTISDETITIIGTSSARITDFLQTDNSSTGLSATAGSVVPNVKRDNDFQLSSVTQVSPGDSGQLQIVRNGVVTSTVTFDENVNNGTYTDIDTLIVTNNVDYGTISGDPLGFNYIYDVTALGTNTVSEGWNTVKLTHNGEETNTVSWYSDQSNPGSPEVTNISITPNSTQNVLYSSTVPHYTSQQQFDISFEVNRLSGDFYPATDNFFDSNSSTPTGSGLQALSDIDYSTAGLPSPLPRNYLVDSGTATITTSAFVKSGTGVSQPNTGPSAQIHNSYNSTTVTFPIQEKILYMIDDFTISSGSPIDETRILVDNVGFGSGHARRVTTLVTIDTPSVDTNNNFDGQVSSLMPHDATVVAGIISHDTTDYSTGYLPIGPNLSVGRDGSQYIQLAFNRTAVSKFAMVWSGKISGCWIKLPGSSIDSTSGLNGWLDTTLPYEGIGIPGTNTTFGGNGSNGCGLAGTVTTGSVVTNQTVNFTFGTESSSNATDNLIMIRFKLEDGDYISSLKFVQATA